MLFHSFSQKTSCFLTLFLVITLNIYSQNFSAEFQKKINFSDSLYLQFNNPEAISFLKKELTTSNDKTEKAALLLRLGNNFMDIQEFDSANTCFNSAFSLLDINENIDLYTNILLRKILLPKQTLKIDENIQNLYDIMKREDFDKINLITKIKIHWYWLSVSWLIKDEEENKKNLSTLVTIVDTVNVSNVKSEMEKYSFFETFSSISSFLIINNKDTLLSKKYLRKAESLFSKNYLRYNTLYLSNAGNFSFYVGDLNASKKKYYILLEIAPKTSHEYCNAHFMIGKIAHQQDSLDLAVKHLKIAESYVKNINEPHYFNLSLIKWLANAYIDRDSSKVGLNYLVRFVQMNKIAEDGRKMSASRIYRFVNQMEAIEQERKNQKIQYENTQFVLKLIIGSTIIISLFFIIALYIFSRLNKKLKKQKSKLESTLSVNNLLTKEMHHRVKNNLQMVSALLNLQSKKQNNTETVKALKDAQSRIQSVATIHQGLYQNEGDVVGKINFKKYTTALANQILLSAKSEQKSIDFKSEIPNDFYLSLDLAVPLGLILNEFITNSIKHAFPSNQPGNITIKAQLQANGKVVLIKYEDNGTGYEENKNKNSFGLSLIDMLSLQLGATIKHYNENGTAYELIFNLQKS